MNSPLRQYVSKICYEGVFDRKTIDQQFRNLIVTKAKHSNFLYITWPDTFEYYVDPKLHYYLERAIPNLPVEAIPYYFSFYEKGIISLNDNWSLYSWCSWLSSQVKISSLKHKSLVVVHFDDYSDYNAPFLYEKNCKTYNILNGAEFSLRPRCVFNAITSGAVSPGGAYVPFLYYAQNIFKHIIVIHIVPEHQRTPLQLSQLTVSATDQSFLDKKIKQLTIQKHPLTLFRKGTTLDGLLEFKTSKIGDLGMIQSYLNEDFITFLDIDLCYFSNRYTLDSDWSSYKQNHDPSWPSIQMEINRCCLLLQQHIPLKKINNISMSTSPGYYPSEYWSDTLCLLKDHFKIS